MDKDKIIGAARHALGVVKEEAGKLVGDAKLQLDGKAEQAAGKLQTLKGSAKDTMPN